jgi:hypothetical protein
MARAPALFGTNRLKKAQEKPLDSREIARAAYELYLQRGGADGHDLDDWLKAEAILRQRR